MATAEERTKAAHALNAAEANWQLASERYRKAEEAVQQVERIELVRAATRAAAEAAPGAARVEAVERLNELLDERPENAAMRQRAKSELGTARAEMASAAVALGRARERFRLALDLADESTGATGGV